MTTLVPIPKCTVTRTGATFALGASLEDLVFALNSFVAAHEETRWCIGDTINQIEERFAKKYDIAVQTTKYERSTLWSLASVCARVATSCRHEDLLFGHHEAVASLLPAKQRKYLALAASKSPRMTVAELRQIVRENEGTCEEGTEDCSPRNGAMKHITMLSIWTKQQDPSTWEKRRRAAVKQELAPLVEFYNRL